MAGVTATVVPIGTESAWTAQNVIEAASSLLVFWQRSTKLQTCPPNRNTSKIISFKFDTWDQGWIDHCCPASFGCSPSLGSFPGLQLSISPATAAGVAAVIQLEKTHCKWQPQRLFLWVKWHCVHLCVGPKGTCNVITGGDYLVAVWCVCCLCVQVLGEQHNVITGDCYWVAHKCAHMCVRAIWLQR